MRKSSIFTTIIIVSIVLIKISFAMDSGDNMAKTNEPRSQKLESGIEKKANSIKELSKKYLITREQAINGKGFISEERKGTSYLVTTTDDNGKTEVTLFFDDHRKTIAQAVIDEKNGNSKAISYFENGEVSQYIEGKNSMAHGVWIDFYDDGHVKSFVEFKDNKYFGRAMEWDKFGKLIRSMKNDGTREFKRVE